VSQLAAHEDEVVSAAPWLGLAPTQLVRLLAKGLRPLRD